MSYIQLREILDNEFVAQNSGIKMAQLSVNTQKEIIVFLNETAVTWRFYDSKERLSPFIWWIHITLEKLRFSLSTSKIPNENFLPLRIPYSKNLNKWYTNFCKITKGARIKKWLLFVFFSSVYSVTSYYLIDTVNRLQCLEAKFRGNFEIMLFMPFSC